MKITRAAAIPLITHDPYFSIWSDTDTLNGGDPVHWSGIRQQLKGYLDIGGVPYCFMGAPGPFAVIPQTGLEVTAASSVYTFENELAKLTVTFTSPLLLRDPQLASRPVSYIDLAVEAKTDAVITARLEVSADVVRYTPGRVIGGGYKAKTFRYAVMGKGAQHPLGNSGDGITIDWGYAYLASADDKAVVAFDANEEKLTGAIELTGGGTHTWAVAYDDLVSIHYFGEFRKGCWASRWNTILEAIASAFDDHDALLAECAGLDTRLYEAALAEGGEDYAFLCTMSYRHTIAAHKLIYDENGELILLSKENDSNGCIGTVDVTYPSAPMFALAGSEYVKALLRPVFRFAQCDVWEFDFAPHDVGRYPYADGQVYGAEMKPGEFDYAQGSVVPPLWMYPAGSGVYGIRYQMPVEECGNMLTLTAAICLAEGSTAFADPVMDILETWTGYLLKYGADPGEQLCTDDFAGHLAHNVNLSAKAIVGIEALAQIKKLAGDEAACADLHKKAADMAAGWQERAFAGDHYVLAFGSENTWSLKYNLVWDKLFDSHLFDEKVYAAELPYYVKMSNKYGAPLDSRATYTKSDWIVWCAAMTEDKELRSALISPIADYLRESGTRVPYSDWYDTITGNYVHFRGRSVQGGMFMPLLAKRGLKG